MFRQRQSRPREDTSTADMAQPAWPMQVVRVSMRAVQPRSCRHSASGPVAACAAKPLETASKGPATFARASRGPGKTKPVWDTDRERDSSPRTSAWARACADDLSWGGPKPTCRLVLVPAYRLDLDGARCTTALRSARQRGSGGTGRGRCNAATDKRENSGPKSDEVYASRRGVRVATM
jgi:hypothetical protein